MHKTHGYAGKVYQAPSGEWAFKFYENGVELGGGAGFDSEAAAVEGCDEVLSDYPEEVTPAERAERIQVVKFEDLAG